MTEQEYENRIQTGLGNYYGEVAAYKINGIYYLSLENYDGTWATEISEHFYKEFKKEFPEPRKRDIRI